jgi:hypothetical protein
MSHLIVIQTKKSLFQNRSKSAGSSRNDVLSVSYDLIYPFEFATPHVARLAGFGGFVGSVVVFCDFVAPQNFNGELKQVLGFKGSTSASSWVPLLNNTIPGVGVLTFQTTAETTSFTERDAKGITVIIEVAPKDLIYGAGGATRV